MEEKHRSHRSPWLRAAVLGLNDGIVSNSSLMLGITAANATQGTIVTAGLAGIVAGALSMAAGEYVSVSSQRDSEKADLAIEAKELELYADDELQELADIYVGRGLDKELALQVARQLHDHGALAAHARDELGIDHEDLANPAQAGIVSAVSFAAGSSLPVIAAYLSKGATSVVAIIVVSLVALLASGAIGARIGGGNRLIAALRVFFGGGVAMAATALIGHFIGRVI